MGNWGYNYPTCRSSYNPGYICFLVPPCAIAGGSPDPLVPSACSIFGLGLPPTWRMGSQDLDTWLITMVIINPLNRIVGPRIGLEIEFKIVLNLNLRPWQYHVGIFPPNMSKIWILVCGGWFLLWLTSFDWDLSLALLHFSSCRILRLRRAIPPWPWEAL